VVVLWATERDRESRRRIAKRLASANDSLSREESACKSGRGELKDALGQRGDNIPPKLDRSRSDPFAYSTLPSRNDDLSQVGQDSACATEHLGREVDRLVVSFNRRGGDARRGFIRAKRGDESRGLVREAQCMGEKSRGELVMSVWRFSQDGAVSCRRWTYRDGSEMRWLGFFRG
jgi:hypothetical protein